MPRTITILFIISTVFYALSFCVYDPFWISIPTIPEVASTNAFILGITGLSGLAGILASVLCYIRHGCLNKLVMLNEISGAITILFAISTVFFAMSVCYYGLLWLSFIPVVASIDAFIGDISDLTVLMGTGGLVAGALGIVSIVLYSIAKANRLKLNVSSAIVFLPIIYGILWVVYFMIGLYMER